MEGTRFDYLARAVATSGWRRQVLSAHCGAVGNELSLLTRSSIAALGFGLGPLAVSRRTRHRGERDSPALAVSRPGAGQGN
jgi:hypothetical protein